MAKAQYVRRPYDAVNISQLNQSLLLHTLNRISHTFRIGQEARTPHVILTNVINTINHEFCLKPPDEETVAVAKTMDHTNPVVRYALLATGLDPDDLEEDGEARWAFKLDETPTHVPPAGLIMNDDAFATMKHVRELLKKKEEMLAKTTEPLSDSQGVLVNDLIDMLKALERRVSDLAHTPTRHAVDEHVVASINMLRAHAGIAPLPPVTGPEAARRSLQNFAAKLTQVSEAVTKVVGGSPAEQARAGDFYTVGPVSMPRREVDDLIEQAAQHHERLRDAEDAKAMAAEGLGAQTCVLCKRFKHIPGLGICRACPVYQKTREAGCCETPYDALVGVASDYMCNEEKDNMAPRPARALHNAEIEFLRSLKTDPYEHLPEEKQEQLRLLDESIAHHERLKACTTEDEYNNEGWNATACALCQRYASRVPSAQICVGCPIYQHTGQDGCRGTPYHDLSRALDTFVMFHGAGPINPALHDAEINFLKEVRQGVLHGK